MKSIKKYLQTSFCMDLQLFLHFYKTNLKMVFQEAKVYICVCVFRKYICKYIFSLEISMSVHTHIFWNTGNGFQEALVAQRYALSYSAPGFACCPLRKQLLEAGERPVQGWTALHVKCCECSESRLCANFKPQVDHSKKHRFTVF